MTSWPLEQARLLQRRPLSASGKVAFQTGFGPSGGPTVGTFAEVVRTEMVRRAYRDLTGETTSLIVFADDYDALRRVPDGLPQDISRYLGHPLTSIPDPWGTQPSFGQHNTDLLQGFIRDIGRHIDVNAEMMSATECYNSGVFNDGLRLVLDHYEEIMAIILPTLGEERRATYSPFLPVSPLSGQVLQVPIEIIDRDSGQIAYRDPHYSVDDHSYSTSIFNGNVKLQWKVDWAMRWIVLGADYEMFGKDLMESYKLASKINRVMGGTPPVGMVYEMFLDAEGHKVSKSVGNGFSVEQWLSYGLEEGLAYYMFQNPRVAKKLTRDDVVRTHDHLFRDLLQHSVEPVDNESAIANTFGLIPIPAFNADVSYSLLVNLASAAGPTVDVATLEGFVESYRGDLADGQSAMLRRIYPRVIAYCRDVVYPQLVFRTPLPVEAEHLRRLVDVLGTMSDDLTAEEYQAVVYEIGKSHAFATLRDWFRTVYEVVFGSSDGPRVGQFIRCFGRERTMALISERLL